MRLFPLFLCVSAILVAQDEPAPTGGRGGRGASDEPINATTFAGLRARNIGPVFISGRVSQIAMFPDSTSHYLIAEASGGVWLTYNNGTTWTPVFDNQGSYSIGTIAIDPKNPSIVDWLCVPAIQRLLARNWNLASSGSLLMASIVANSVAVSTPLRIGLSMVMVTGGSSTRCRRRRTSATLTP